MKILTPRLPAWRLRLRGLPADSLRRYPDPACDVLTEAIADVYGVKKEQVFVGVGSDDVLAMAFMTFFNSKKPDPVPGCDLLLLSGLGRSSAAFPMSARRWMRISGFARKTITGKMAALFFPIQMRPRPLRNPFPLLRISCPHNRDVIVIVDEAYIDFGGASALPLLEKYDNLLVVQTFSKSRSMAGMRIGYAFGSPLLIKYMNDVKYSYNSYTLNAAALACGAASVRDTEYFAETTAKIVATRERAAEELVSLGFSMTPSKANFLFVTHARIPAKELFEALKQQDIFVRYFASPRIDNYLRITVGTDAEMDELLAFLKKYVETH